MNIKRIFLTLTLIVCLIGGGRSSSSHPDKSRLRGNGSSLSSYVGMCAASAVVPLGPDMFIVGDDESNILRVYSVGKACIIQDFSIAENRDVDTSKKIDIEGGTRLGDYIFWIGSHSTSDGKPKPTRRQLFAVKAENTAKDGFKLTPFGNPYMTLLEDIAKDKDGRFKKYNLGEAATRVAETDGALNIEGLSATRNGGLMIGFRNPIPNKKALIITLHNPMEVVAKGTAVFEEPIELDLGGFGIRDIAWWEEGKSYIIIAGRPDDKNESRLYQWTGEAQSNPEEIKTGLLAGLQPEAVAIYPSTQPGGCRLLILSDDEEKTGDRKCYPEKGFRGVVIQLQKQSD